jgi:hypothetical protein
MGREVTLEGGRGVGELTNNARSVPGRKGRTILSEPGADILGNLFATHRCARLPSLPTQHTAFRVAETRDTVIASPQAVIIRPRIPDRRPSAL